MKKSSVKWRAKEQLNGVPVMRDALSSETERVDPSTDCKLLLAQRAKPAAWPCAAQRKI